MKVNYYEVLGVPKTASESEIRQRFRELAREHHPDRHSGESREEAELKFQELTAAVNVLTQPERRKQHDAELQKKTAASPTDPKQVAKAYLAKGVKAYKEGDFSTARANFDMAAKHDPTDAKAFHNLALVCAKIPSAIRDAVNSAEKAVELEPLNPVYLKDAGLIAKQAGLNAKAQRYLEQALEWDSDNHEVNSALAELKGSRESREGGKGLLDSLFKKG
ncbi:MAG: DnaJ domain-containing protein [Thermoanaerobaculia bacterium]|nr:DnaJ domain-containing protein [Thermoanaerobaculia bacterium]